MDNKFRVKSAQIFVRKVTHGFGGCASVRAHHSPVDEVLGLFRVGPEPGGEQMADKYASFDALRRGEREDIDYRIRIVDAELRDAVCNRLATAGFAAAVVTSGMLAARGPRNICNRGERRVGVQLEITQGLRNAQRKDTATLMPMQYGRRSARMEHEAGCYAAAEGASG
jgi:phage replication-related protein YjqB (UPF0714/DUF867 family)